MSKNTQMFALKNPPAEAIQLAGHIYRLVRVFKHDFWSATCLYQCDVPVEIPKIVVKCGRTHPFCGLPLQAVGLWQRNHEGSIYEALRGIDGIPRWLGLIGQYRYAIEYIDGKPLDHAERPPTGFFDRLAELFAQVHARGVAYSDSNKRSNILIGPGGKPYLIDYQISFRRRDDLPRPISTIIGWLVEYISAKDIYHIYKQKRRLCPDELTDQEQEISRHRSGLHQLHRKLAKGYRAMRRWFLHRQHIKGRLISPSAEMEDHHQPEKLSWRSEKPTP